MRCDQCDRSGGYTRDPEGLADRFRAHGGQALYRLARQSGNALEAEAGWNQFPLLPLQTGDRLFLPPQIAFEPVLRLETCQIDKRVGDLQRKLTFLDEAPDVLKYVREGRNVAVLRTCSKIQARSRPPR